MVNDNSEDKSLPVQRNSSGGLGELVPEDKSARESLQLIKRAVVNGWDIPDAWKDALPKMCMKMVLDDNRGDRERLRAMEILRAMNRDNLEAAQVLDRLERLDGGMATERIELAPIEWNPGR